MTREEFLIYIVAIAANCVAVAVTYLILGSILNGDLKSFKSSKRSERNKNDEQDNNNHDDRVDQHQSS